MKASVQYNDFIGTAAADISDWITLKGFLEKKGVDTNRYEAIGAEFYHGERYFNASIICKDNESDNPNEAVKISFENGLSEDEFFQLFKRFNVVIVNSHRNYQDMELCEETIILPSK